MNGGIPVDSWRLGATSPRVHVIGRQADGRSPAEGRAAGAVRPRLYVRRHHLVPLATGRADHVDDEAVRSELQELRTAFAPVRALAFVNVARVSVIHGGLDRVRAGRRVLQDHLDATIAAYEGAVPLLRFRLLATGEQEEGEETA
jgi:hypothetical protein